MFLYMVLLITLVSLYSPLSCRERRRLMTMESDFTGARTERGSGNAIGTNLNYPLAHETTPTTYLKTLDEATNEINKFGPSLLIVS